MEQKRSASHRAKIKNSTLYRSQDGLLNSQVDDGRAIDALSAPSGFRTKSAQQPGVKTVRMRSPAGLGASDAEGTVMDIWPPLRLKMKRKRELEAIEQEGKKPSVPFGKGQRRDMGLGGSQKDPVQVPHPTTEQIWDSTSSTLVDDAGIMESEENGANISTTSLFSTGLTPKGPSVARALLTKCQELTSRVGDLEEKEKVWMGRCERLQGRVDTLEVEVAELVLVASRLQKLEDHVATLVATEKDDVFFCGEDTQVELSEMM